jgi:hypothetical protein
MVADDPEITLDFAAVQQGAERVREMLRVLRQRHVPFAL